MLRLLLLADTHLGFDQPRRPRVQQRRRGPDFFTNFERALQPALNGEVDLVVHGGDLLFRSKVPPALVEQALTPLRRVADAGVPVALVPGNHERSQIPCGLLARHQRLLVFDRPRTFVVEAAGLRVALAGFPAVRDDVRHCFAEKVEETGWREVDADVRLLCLHQAIEGATVGPADFVFRSGDDVIRGRDLPPGFAAVLAGHIHRQQVLTHDLSGARIAAPVFYPGSIERTSFAEKAEVKGYLRIDIDVDTATCTAAVTHRFCRLPARPMVSVDVAVDGIDAAALEARITAAIAAAPPDAVLQLRLTGASRQHTSVLPTAARLRELAPSTMNVEVVGYLASGRDESLRRAPGSGRQFPAGPR